MDGRRRCSKCLLFHLPCSLDDNRNGQRTVPSFLELGFHSVSQNILEHIRLDLLAPYLCQLIFDELVRTRYLNWENLENFRECHFSLIHLGGYPRVRDYWMKVIASQGESLESLDISCSDVTDCGLVLLKDCFNLRKLALNYCFQISNKGLGFMSSLSHLMSLSIIKNSGLTAEGMGAFANLGNLVNLNLERCSRINGGLIHLRGLTKLKSLNIKYCHSVTDEDMEPLSVAQQVPKDFSFFHFISKPSPDQPIGLTNLKELNVSCTKVTDLGIAFLKGLRGLSHLHLQGCPVTTISLRTISGFTSLLQLNLNRCSLSDEGCEDFSELIQLKDLDLGCNNITNASLIHLKGLINLESLNLDSCTISCEGLLNIRGLTSLRSLELSETTVKNEALGHLSDLHNLENLNLSFTFVDDNGLEALSTLTSLKSLNLDSLDITGVGVPLLASLIGLTHLDLSGCIIDDFNLDQLKCFKNLQSLEIWDGILIDDDMDIIKGLTSLKLLNLSKNFRLTDRALESVSGLTALCLLNLSDNSDITDAGLLHLTPLKNLRSLYLDLTEVTAAELRRLQAHVLPNLLIFRPGMPP